MSKTPGYSDITYLGVHGWTQTEHGTLFPPDYIDSTDVFIDNVGTTLDAELSDNAIQQIKRALGYLEKPLVKCRHCGQWGAVYCACAHCGAPIDPEGQ